MGKSTDATRAERKAKKRALEAAIPDLPGDDNAVVTTGVSSEPEKEKKDKSKKRKRGGEVEEITIVEEEMKSKKSKKERKRKEEEVVPEVVEEAEKSTKKEKKSKKEKKASKSEDAVEEEVTQSVNVDTVMEEASEAPKKSKKERKAERRAKEVAANGITKKDDAIEPVLEIHESEEGVKKEKKPKEKTETAEDKKSKKNNRNREKKRKGAVENGEAGEEKDKKPARFIVFVGNLPFSATTDSITAHFASVHPQSVRHLTKKEDPTKSKGCAFVEFAGYDHMKTCLKLMHHSTFDDGKSAPRKINVELTAGGGGNTVERKSKIEAKNAKLNEERIRKIHEEEKAKLEKVAEGVKNGTAAIDESAIHPSRRGRVPVMT